MNSVGSFVFLWRIQVSVPGSDDFTVAIISFAAASNAASLSGFTLSFAITVIGIVVSLRDQNFNHSTTVVSTPARFFKANRDAVTRLFPCATRSVNTNNSAAHLSRARGRTYM